MNTLRSHLCASGWLARFGIGLLVGGGIVYVDNVASHGEVSPIVIVAILFAVTAAAGMLLGRRAWIAALAVWACIPTAHLIKHVWRLPDTLHPNTYASIAYLAAFTLVVAVAGVGAGTLARGTAAGGDGPSTPGNKSP
jgi:hypothetical protein